MVHPRSGQSQIKDTWVSYRAETKSDGILSFPFCDLVLLPSLRFKSPFQHFCKVIHSIPRLAAFISQVKASKHTQHGTLPPSLLHQESPIHQHAFQRVHDAVKTRLCTTLLREAGNRQVGFAAMVQDGEDLDGERNRLDVESFV